MPTPSFPYAGDLMKFDIGTVFDNKYLKTYDLGYGDGKHYYMASRRDAGGVAASMTDEEFWAMLPDAVTCCVIFTDPGDAAGENDRLLLSYEFRYPCGRYLLSPPAGLIDPEDRSAPDALLRTAEREIKEETGLELDRERGDRLFEVSPLLFSSPGMTDESNGIACAVLNRPWTEAKIGYGNATGTEMFDGSLFVSRSQARELIKRGRDEYGNFYSVYTALVLFCFLSGIWKE